MEEKTGKTVDECNEKCIDDSSRGTCRRTATNENEEERLAQSKAQLPAQNARLQNSSNITSDNLNKLTNEETQFLCNARVTQPRLIETDKDEKHSKECNPIILSVRGNATDIECLAKTSTSNNDNSRVPTSTSLVSVTSCQKAMTLVTSLHHNTEESAALSLKKSDCEKTTGNETSVVTVLTGKNALLNATSQEVNPDTSMSSPSTFNATGANKDKTSTTDENTISQIPRNLTMPASSILLNMMSNATYSEAQNVSITKVANQSEKMDSSSIQVTTCGINELTAVPLPCSVLSESLKRSVSNTVSSNSGLISISKIGQAPKSMLSRPINISLIPNRASHSSSVLSNNLKHTATRTAFSDGNKKPVVYTTTPHSAAVKIVLKRPQNVLPKAIPASNSTSDNSNKRLGTNNPQSHYKSVVEKIFSNASKQEGMTRAEVFLTDILKPLKKTVREDKDKSFVCSVCSDEFHLDEFLKHHLDRKIFILIYYCKDCKEKLTFFNKCQFWLHLRKENPKGIDHDGLINGTSYFNLKPYSHIDNSEDFPWMPKVQCNFCNGYYSTSLAEHLKRNDASTVVNNCNKCGLFFFNKCALQAHVTIHEARFKDVVCPECGENIPHSDGLKALFDHLDSCHHFNYGYNVSCQCKKSFTSIPAIRLHMLKSHTKLLLRCHSCLSCFSSFQLLAKHCKTIHNTTPLVSKVVLCTLCNQGFQNFWKLKSHIEEHTCNLTAVRKRILSCFLCKKSFDCPDTLNSHVEKDHTHRPKRCTICFGLFESRQNLVEHIVTKSCTFRDLPTKLHLCLDMPTEEEDHIDIEDYKRRFSAPHEKALKPSQPLKSVSVSREAHSNKTKTSTSNLSEKTIQIQDRQKNQCHSCKICLIGSHHYAKHLALHKSNGFVRSQTECCICKKTVADTLIKSHMENHQKRGIIVCSLCHSRSFDTMYDALQHSKNLCFYKEVENDGASHIQSNESSNPNGNVESFDLTEEVTELEMPPPNEPVSQEESSMFPCLMCGLAFSTKQAKEDHVGRIHDGTRIMYFCLLCKRKGVRKYFLKKNLISKHICHKHRIVNPNAIASLIHEEEQNVTSGRVIPTEHNNGECNGDVSPPKRLRLASEGEFMCGKCGFSSEDSKVFEDHITIHNPKKEPQCPECGLCFTVLAALKKHLFVVHKIKKMDEYLQKKGMLEPEEEEPMDDDDVDITCPDNSVLVYNPSEEENDHATHKRPKFPSENLFECNVCYRTFSSEIVLKSHMRNHGMAFIRSRRHDKTSS